MFRFLLIMSTLITSCGVQGQVQMQSFMPENYLHIYDSLAGSNISEQEFNQIIAEAQNIYKPIISTFGGNFVIQKDWMDSTVNAYATKQGNTWIVKMFGGMARRQEMTPDGFRLVVCHEIGHHMAGFPLYQNSDMSNEGQSDYFATHVCFRKMMENKRDQLTDVHPKITSDCNGFWKNSKNRYICKRAMMGGISLSNLLASLGGERADIERKDPKRVPRTQDSHPAAQCRLDTYVAGSLCKNSWEDRTIPMSEGESTSCENRPTCWYAR